MYRNRWALILNLIAFWPGLEDFLIRAAGTGGVSISGLAGCGGLVGEVCACDLVLQWLCWLRLRLRLTGSILPSSDLEELLDVCDFAGHGCGLRTTVMGLGRLMVCRCAVVVVITRFQLGVEAAAGNFGTMFVGGISQAAIMSSSPEL